MVAGYLYLPKKYNHILNLKDMTWEEKFSQVNKEISDLINRDSSQSSDCRAVKIFGNNGCCSSNRKGVIFQAYEAMLEGDIEKLKSLMPTVEKQYKALRLATKTFFAYKGKKELKFYGGINKQGESQSSCGINPLLIIASGTLCLTFPEYIFSESKLKGSDLEKVAKGLLNLSRFVRDAEDRCLKHPRHQQV